MWKFNKRKFLSISWIAGGAVYAASATFAIAEEPPTCKVRPFTSANIEEILQRERSIRKDLPPQSEEDTSISVRRDGCYYVLTEWELPKRPGSNTVFVFDQYGVIIDVILGH